MFQSYGIVVDHKNAHVLRNHTGFISLLLSVRLAQRDGYRECSAFSFFTGNINVAVHKLYDAFSDGHAQTGRGVFTGRGGFFLSERVKNVWKKFFAHPDTGIADD